MRERSAAGRQRSASRCCARLAVIGALMLLAACGGSETAPTTSTSTPTATRTPTTTTTTTTTPPETTTTAPPTTTTTAAPGTTLFRGNTVTTSGAESGDQGGHLVDVTVERLEGFTRITFEFDGPGTPFWQIGPTQRPFFVDNTVPADRAVSGTDYISVIAFPAEVGTDFTGSLTVLLTDGPVAEVTFLGNGSTGMHWVIGTRGEKPFLGSTYRDPARFVLDVGD